MTYEANGYARLKIRNTQETAKVTISAAITSKRRTNHSSSQFLATVTPANSFET